MPSTASTFQEYLDATKPNTADITDALSFAATCHPVFRNNAIVQDIINGKGFTSADLAVITKTAVAHAVSIAKKSLTLPSTQQLSINAEVHVINGAIAYLNAVRLQMVQDAVTSLSEIDAVRRYSKGKL